jgi:SWI/SNF-related matrix-associated actin-dependent regulator of chromatin subfamily A member 5
LFLRIELNGGCLVFPAKLEEQLHRMLKPLLLRRERDQVLHDLPPKKEFIIYTPLSPQQREYYVSILKKDVSGVLKEDKRSLVNVLMNLRKAWYEQHLNLFLAA